MSILEQITAKDVMVQNISITSDTSVIETLDVLVANKQNGILVVDKDILRGVVTDYDLINWLKEGKLDDVDVKISEIMTKDFVYSYPDDKIKKIISIMFEKKNRFMPILSNNRSLGVITRREIGKIFAKHYGHRYKARDLMTHRFTTISINDTLKTFFDRIKEYDDKYSIIMSNDEIVGVVTPMDILKHLRQKRKIDVKTSINELMTPHPYVARPEDGCDVLAQIMVDRNFSGIPIVDERLEGMIRYSCFLQFLDI